MHEARGFGPLDAILEHVRRYDWATYRQLFTPKLVTALRRGYSLDDFRRDTIAGITVAILALPLSMAIAIGAGVTPDKDLITAVVAGLLISAGRQPLSDWRAGRGLCRYHCPGRRAAWARGARDGDVPCGRHRGPSARRLDQIRGSGSVDPTLRRCAPFGARGHLLSTAP
jgi:Sulfate permease family